jgi:hypothetical protein
MHRQASTGTMGPPGVRNGAAASRTSRTRSTQAEIATAMYTSSPATLVKIASCSNVPLSPECERNHHVGDDRHVRRVARRVHGGEHRRQEPVAAEREDRSRAGQHGPAQEAEHRGRGAGQHDGASARAERHAGGRGQRCRAIADEGVTGQPLRPPVGYRCTTAHAADRHEGRARHRAFRLPHLAAGLQRALDAHEREDDDAAVFSTDDSVGTTGQASRAGSTRKAPITTNPTSGTSFTAADTSTSLAPPRTPRRFTTPAAQMTMSMMSGRTPGAVRPVSAANEAAKIPVTAAQAAIALTRFITPTRKPANGPSAASTYE